MTPALRTELSRVFAAESVADTVKDDGEEHGIRHPPEERNRLKLIAIELANPHLVKKSLLDLYRTASTPEEAAEVLRARGRPWLARQITTMRSTPAKRAAEDLRMKADFIEQGVLCSGWFEPHEKEAPGGIPSAAKVQVAAALRWCAGVFERYMLKQGPIVAPDVPKKEPKTKGKTRATWSR